MFHAPDHAMTADSPTWAGRAALLALTCVVVVNLAVVAPVRNYLLDFRAYYAAGAALRAGLDPYDTALVQQHIALPGQQSIVPYVYPPPTLALAWAFAGLPYPAAQVPWALLQAGLGVAAFIWVCRTYGLALGGPGSVLLGVVFAGSSSVAQLFRWGQFDLIVVALLAVAGLALTRERRVLGGVLLGLATIAKVTPGAYLIVLLMRREWRALAAAAATILATLGVSAALLPAGTFVAWRANLARLSGEVTVHNQSLRGYLLAGFTEFTEKGVLSVPWVALAPATVQAAAILLAGLILGGTLLWVFRHRKHLTTAESIAVLVPAVLLAAPLTWMHHGVQLLLPLAVLAARLERGPQAKGFGLACVATATLLMLWPVQQFELELAPALRHIVGPTFTYGVALTWLLVMTWGPVKVKPPSESTL
ncbi:MAG: DUF2029 domain-containing protein [Phycisphaerales bacterium]|nr:DUF2029 domain-containing protein [Phycisphaerales bacterium]